MRDTNTAPAPVVSNFLPTWPLPWRPCWDWTTGRRRSTHFRVRHGKSVAKHRRPAAVSYTPRQVAQLYQFPLDVDGAGQTVGILEFGGGYRAADLKNYFSSLGVAEPNVISVSVDKGKKQTHQSEQRGW